MEGHVTEKNEFYYDDPCMRFGSPPGEGICIIYGNLDKVMMAIADGKLIKPEFTGSHVAEVMLQVREPGTGQVEIEIPKKYENNVMIRNLCKLDGKFHHLAVDKEPIIGAAVAVAHDPYTAMDNAMEIASKVKGDGVYFDVDGFDEIEESIKKMKKLGWEKF